MSYAPSQEQRFDHARDLAKHEPSPFDRQPGDIIEPMDLRLAPPPMSEALEIAILVKAISPLDGAKLIEQYGKTCESKGRLDGVTQTLDRLAPPVPTKCECGKSDLTTCYNPDCGRPA
jgi:hypothetical protein